jgi:hypothetical protein
MHVWLCEAPVATPVALRSHPLPHWKIHFYLAPWLDAGTLGLVSLPIVLEVLCCNKGRIWLTFKQRNHWPWSWRSLLLWPEVCVPPYSCVEILTPRVMVVRDRAFRRLLSWMNECPFIYLFLMVLGIEFGALHLVGRCATTWDMPPDPFAYFIINIWSLAFAWASLR